MIPRHYLIYRCEPGPPPDIRLPIGGVVTRAWLPSTGWLMACHEAGQRYGDMYAGMLWTRRVWCPADRRHAAILDAAWRRCHGE